MNFKCSEEGDDGGVWLLFGMDVWICNTGLVCELVGSCGNSFGGGDILDYG